LAKDVPLNPPPLNILERIFVLEDEGESESEASDIKKNLIC
jgi:hypothetical protein